MTLTLVDVQGCSCTERAKAIQIDSVNADGGMLWTDNVLRENHFGDYLNVEYHASKTRAVLADC